MAELTLDQYFELAWKQYTETTPCAANIHSLLIKNGENVINDHVAFRTFDHEKIGLNQFIKFFAKWGYEVRGEYTFEEKKLSAIHLENKNDSSLPKIFVSQLKNHLFSNELQQLINKVISQESKSFDDLILKDQKSWKVSYEEYEMANHESEYAAWVLAHGIRPNHFTVYVNELTKYNNLNDLNQFLKNNGFTLNNSGGEIKGSVDVLLEQSSTMADKIKVQFCDGEKEVSSCYYEFAKRYSDSKGNIFQGFVTKSADKIFESTYEK
ncbi:MAG: DUF1338 domain-containing protein [Oligoflexia bacterium]|nr:DUF1338 domain-containing protein [Oligoflexia bacterium]